MSRVRVSVQGRDAMEKLGVGFVGAGWMGRALLREVNNHPNARVVALHQRDRTKAAEALGSIGLPADRFRASYQDLVDDVRVQAVFVCSPNALHGAQTISALEAGKHVFCEKPCATDYQQYRRQLALERQNPALITYVDYILYFDEMEQRLRKMVADGLFGQLTQVQINYRHAVDITGHKVWKLSRELMGDAIGMGVVHALSVMHWLMDANGARPTSVFATSAKAKVRPFEPDAIWNIQVRYDNGATGTCLGNIDNGNGYDAHHNLYGTHGGFVFDSGQDRPQKVRYWSSRHADGKWIWPLDQAKCAEQRTTEFAWPQQTTTPDSGNVIHHQTREAVAHFLSCATTGRRSPLGFTNSAPIADVGWAAQVSARTGRSVSLPLDPAATEVLT